MKTLLSDFILFARYAAAIGTHLAAVLKISTIPKLVTVSFTI